MNKDIVPHKTPRALARQGLRLPAIIDDAGENAQRKFVEFFVARIRNKNTRAAYGRAIMQFFEQPWHMPPIYCSGCMVMCP